jgi:hypothetical protein
MPAEPLSGPVPFEVRWVFSSAANGTHIDRLSRANVGFFSFADSVVSKMAKPWCRSQLPAAERDPGVSWPGVTRNALVAAL